MSLLRHASLQVRGSKAFGYGIARRVDTGPPVNISPPVIIADGPPVTGVNLIIDTPPTWDDFDSLAYQWFQDDVLLPDQTGELYSPAAEGLYKLRASATNSYGTTHSFSNEIEIGPLPI